MAALNSEYIKKYEELRKEIQQYEDNICERITEILKYIHNLAKVKLDTWYFPDAAEGEVGKINVGPRDNFYYPDISLVQERKGKRGWNDDEFLIILDGKEYNLFSSIPSEWLCDNSFREIIKKGRDLYLTETKKDKIKKLKRETSKKELIQNAIKKLTKEEIKALKIK